MLYTSGSVGVKLCVQDDGSLGGGHEGRANADHTSRGHQELELRLAF